MMFRRAWVSSCSWLRASICSLVCYRLVQKLEHGWRDGIDNRLQPAVYEYRADHRFEAAAEIGQALATAAEFLAMSYAQKLAQSEARADPRQGLGSDERRAQLRQLALRWRQGSGETACQRLRYQ